MCEYILLCNIVQEYSESDMFVMFVGVYVCMYSCVCVHVHICMCVFSAQITYDITVC